MSSLIPFESTNLPAHLRSVDVKAFNSDLTAHASAGFPVISIKGKVFAVVRDGERVVLPNPKDPESPATSIDVVLIKANKDKSKVFYIDKYDPNSTDGNSKKPDCYSANGTTPAADSEHPQAKSCAVCPHNAWGSATNDKGVHTKGKACQDSVRLAVAPGGTLNDPMLVRVPPASIKALGEYGTMLAKRGVAYNMVVTKIAFDQEAESPKLTFKPVGYLSEEDYAQVKETLESDTVENIIGVGSLFEGAPAADEVDIPGTPPTGKPAETPAAPPAPAPEKPKATRAAKPKEEPKPEPVKTQTISEDPDLDIDGIEFDD